MTDIYAQEVGKADVFGYVRLPEKDHNPLFTASVRLYAGQDTLKTVTQGQERMFLFKKVSVGKYTLEVSGVGYEPYVHQYDFGPGDNIVYVQLKAARIDAAVVSSEVPVMKQVKDTTIYFAAAANVADGENAMELLRNMPGFEIRGNNIYHNGEKVARTYVNGMLVFGDTPSNAFEHILAEDVRQVKSYHEDSREETLKGLRRPRREKVLDVVTREKVVTAVDAYAMAKGGADASRNSGGDIQGRYAGGVTANFFSEKFLTDVNVFANNLGYSSNLASISQSLSGALNDYKEALHAGIGAQRYWGRRYQGNNVSFRYSYDRDYSGNLRRSLSDFIPSGASPALSYSDSSLTSAISGTHKVSMSVTIPTSPIYFVSIMGDVSFRDGRTDAIDRRWGGEAGHSGQVASLSDNSRSDGLSSNLILSWMDNDPDHKFRPGISATLSYGKDNAMSWRVDTLATSLFRQYLNIDDGAAKLEMAVTPAISYCLSNSFSDTRMFTLSYSLTKNRSSSVRAGFDWLDNTSSPVPDPVNTYRHSWDHCLHYVLLSYMQRSGMDFEADAGIGVSTASHRTSEDIAGHESGTNSYWSLLPFFLVRKLNKWEVRMSSERSYPSEEQTRDWLDNSSPMCLRAGNPGLKAPYHITVKSVYFPNLGQRQIFPSVSFDLRYTVNSIVERRQYFDSGGILPEYGNYAVPKGAFLYTYANANPTLDASLSFRMSNRGMSGRSKFYFQDRFVVGYETSPQYVADDLIHLHEGKVTNEFSVKFAPSKAFMANLQSRTGYGYGFSAQSDLSLHSFSENIRLSVTKYFFKTYKVMAEYSWDHRSYPGSSYTPINMQELNVLVAKTFLKNRLIVSLSAGDVLSRGLSYSVTVAADSVNQTWSPSFGRYYLVGVSYRFNRLGAGEFKGSLNRGDL